MSRRARILVAASSKSRAQVLGRALQFVDRKCDLVSGTSLPRSFAPYRLLICELGPRLRSPEQLLGRLREDAHVILILPSVEVHLVAQFMQDLRVSHLLAQSDDQSELAAIVEKLDSGQIFGLDRYLPPNADLRYRRIDSYASRCAALDELEELLRLSRVRGRLRRAAAQVTEELLMNAMYQAPITSQGQRIFAEVSPRARIRRKTPRPVSLRFSSVDGAFFLSVRDRYGSFRRSDLAHYLLRCALEEVQIEQKELGAGLGLYLVTSTVDRLIINILPGRISEFICTLRPTKAGVAPVKCVSVSTQLPPSV